MSRMKYYVLQHVISSVLNYIIQNNLLEDVII